MANRKQPIALKQLRESKRYSAREAAEGSGISFSTYVAYENEYRSPSLTNAKKIADFFGLKVEDIKFKEKGESAL